MEYKKGTRARVLGGKCAKMSDCYFATLIIKRDIAEIWINAKLLVIPERLLGAPMHRNLWLTQPPLSLLLVDFKYCTSIWKEHHNRRRHTPPIFCSFCFSYEIQNIFSLTCFGVSHLL